MNEKTGIDKNELCWLFYFAREYVKIYFVCENKHKEESWSRFH
jgi:hypothetical protein